MSPLEKGALVSPPLEEGQRAYVPPPPPKRERSCAPL